jgi:hypothetical protein
MGLNNPDVFILLICYFCFKPFVDGITEFMMDISFTFAVHVCIVLYAIWRCSCCNPAEAHTKLARTAAFDQIAADRCFATSGLNKVGFAAEKQKEKSPMTFRSSGSVCNPAASYFPTASRQQ